MDVDDIPVGGSKPGANPFGSEFPEEAMPKSNSASGPLEDRILSKKWNERASSYEELSELIKNAKNSKDPIFYDHSGGFSKYLADVNPGALEKAVDWFIMFVNKASKGIISDIQFGAIDLLITKSISHMKPTLQSKGLEAIWCIIESTEDFEGVSEAVCKCIKSSNVKVRMLRICSLFTAKILEGNYCFHNRQQGQEWTLSYIW